MVAGIEGLLLRNQVVPQSSPVNLLGYDRSQVVNTDSTTSVYELFLLGGMPDQFFQFQSSTNLLNPWYINDSLEIFDPSGTLYLLRIRDSTNAPAAGFYRTQLLL
jgi:hypothetical protein